jgi:hypothetical protein
MKRLLLVLLLFCVGCGGTITHGTVIKRWTSRDLNLSTTYFIQIGQEKGKVEYLRTMEVDRETFDKYKIGDYYRRYPQNAEKEE